MGCDCKMKTWEIAVWTFVVFVALMTVAAALQAANERGQWSHIDPRPKPLPRCVPAAYRASPCR